MSFEDQYGITRFKFNNSMISLSIDEDHNDENKINAVMMTVPDSNKRDHDHITFSRSKIKKLQDSLKNNQKFIIQEHFYKFVYSKNIITLFEKDNSGFNEMYSFTINDVIVKEIILWIELFLSLSNEKLLTKYKSRN